MKIEIEKIRTHICTCGHALFLHGFVRLGLEVSVSQCTACNICKRFSFSHVDNRRCVCGHYFTEHGRNMDFCLVCGCDNLKDDEN